MAETIRTAKVMADLIMDVPAIRTAIGADPSSAEQISDVLTKSWPPPAYLGDTWVYRLCVLALAIVAVGALAGAVWLSTQSGARIPDLLTAFGASAIGGLVGLFAPSPGSKV